MSQILGAGGGGGIATPVSVPNGGTGLTTITDHAVMIGSGVAAVTPVGPGTNGQLLIGSTGADPAWAALTSSGGTITVTGGAGTLNIETAGSIPASFPTDAGTATPALGVLNILGLAGANIATSGAGNTVSVAVSGTTQYAVQVGDATGSLDSLPVGTTNTVLLGNTGANPSWGQVDLTTDVTGILPVPNGGTGLSTITDHAIMLGSGVGAVTPLGVAGNGEIPIGSAGADPVLGNITSTDGTLTVTNGAGTIDIEAGTALRIMSGFEAWSGGAPYFDDTTLGQFTVSQAGTGYIQGEPVSWAGGQTETGLTAGNTYYIYMDNTGTIGKTTTYSEALFSDNVVLFECMRDSTSGTNNQVTVKENHPYQFPWATSVWAHDTIGPVIADNQGGANITLNGSQKIEISGADELEDHGLETTIPDSGGVAEVFEQYYTLGTGKWARYAQSDTFDGTWNNAGTPTALGANKYSVNRLYVSKDNLNSATPVYFSVMGDAQYNNLAQADTAIANDSIPTATAELAMLELAQLGYIVFEESSTSIVQVVIAKETARTSFSGSTASIASLILTDTTNFDHILSAADTTVQSALETIDDLTLAGDAGTSQASSAVFTIAGGNDIATSAAGSTVTVALTGTTQYGVQVGDATGGIASVAVGATGETLMGNTGANPSWTGSPSFSGSVTAGTGLIVTTGDATISAGNLNLPTTNAALTEGVIEVNSVRWAHSYGTNNLFIGAGAGNGTTSGSGVNIGIGNNSMDALTTGTQNVALGFDALTDCQDGSYNCALGANALANCTSGGRNMAIGYTTMFVLTTGSYNVGVGASCLGSLVSGSYNIVFGHQAGNSLTTNDSDNIFFSNVGVAGDNNTIRLGTQGTGDKQQDKCFIAGIYNTAPSGGTDQSVIIDSNGQLGAITAFPITWSEVTGTSQSASVNSGYISNNASQVVITLPDTAAVGSILRVTGKGAGGWKIAQNAGETITWDESNSTTTGVGGYLESSDDYDSVELICLTANTLWGILSSKGNITIV